MSCLRGEQERYVAARLRIRAAVKDLVLAKGCDSLTLAGVAEQAGLGIDEVHHHFDSASQAVLDAYLAFIEEFDRRVFGAFASAGNWRPGLRAAAHAAAVYMEEEPREMRFGAISLLEGGPLIQAHRARHLQRLADLVDLGRQELDDPESLGRSVAEAVIGSVDALVVKELQRPGGRSPVEHVPDLMYVAVRPYLGHEIAREELAFAPPDVSDESSE